MTNRSIEEKRTDSPESQSDSGANLPQREQREQKPQEGDFRNAQTSSDKETFGDDYESQQKEEQQQEELDDTETGRTKKS